MHKNVRGGRAQFVIYFSGDFSFVVFLSSEDAVCPVGTTRNKPEKQHFRKRSDGLHFPKVDSILLLNYLSYTSLDASGSRSETPGKF